MISLEEAKARILSFVHPLGTERISVSQALGRVCAREVQAAVDLPGFDNSAMDGYAVQSADTRQAEEVSVALKCAGRIGAGEKFAGTVVRGTCVRLFTGSMLPSGADAVVMQEDTTSNGDVISIRCSAKPFENVRLRGEDIRSGTPILNAGERITATRSSLLAASGRSELVVHRTPTIALIATGNELREPGEPLQPGQIHESNRLLLSGLLAPLGCRILTLPIIRDDLEKTRAALQDAFSKADLVVTTGGVSVGEFDFVKEAFTNLGGKLELWRIAIRPGKPFAFGRVDSKFLFGLPGNPVSALVTFLLLARPAILRLQGASDLNLPELEGELNEPVSNRGDRRHFVRVRWNNGRVRVAGPQASHMLGALRDADGLLDVPPDTSLLTGARVKVQIWEMLESANRL
jgi:molybdopterin molybdotransferase